jgi:protein-disulfide isomerase
MALAAGQIGGSDAYWAMHTWLMEHQVPLDDSAVAQAAAATELDEAALRSAMESPEVSTAIAQDARVAKSAGVRALPFIFVNERWLPRWTREDDPRFLDRVVEEARTLE